jgi:glycosyltransferase involved in cell wall biosynthesis
MDKKKILLLSDDLRFFSGIATMSRELVINTCHKYNWFQLGGSIKNPDTGKIIDISQSIQKDFGIVDANVKVMPADGYGTPELVKQIISAEKPHAILHFTDPRFWGWLYSIEREIRQKIPLLYLNIWDDLPYPLWNKPFYESCDGLFAISKQTKNINENVLGEGNWCSLDNIKTSPCKRLVSYVPHCANEKFFRPLTTEDEIKELHTFKNELLKGKSYDFILFYNNRNIRRKKTSDCMIAYKYFCDMLPKDQAKKCLFLMHTQTRDDAGTDLDAIHKALCKDCNIQITDSIKFDTKKLNMVYNIVDCTINLSDNEGWGLSTTESIMAGTPIIATVTGGLQDQMGFVDDDGKDYFFTPEFPSNHCCKYKNHGEWVTPIWPKVRSLQGSVPTPYIFADHIDFEDAGKAIKHWYDMGRENRKACGLKGREWGLNGHTSIQNMSEKFIESVEAVLDNWTPRKRFDLYKVDGNFIHYPEQMGIIKR